MKCLVLDISFLFFSSLMIACGGNTNSHSTPLDKVTQDVKNSDYDEFLKLENKPGSLAKSFSQAQSSAVHSWAVNHPVVKLSMLSKYDPSGAIGFCFGRAMAVELQSIARGLSKNSIRKLFIIGDLRSGVDPEWRFHVTTLVQNSRGGWTAIDPIMPSAMSAENWITRVKGTWDKNNKARLYLTSGSAVLPDITTFKTPDQELGDRIIELKFDPSKDNEFRELSQFGTQVFALSAQAEKRLFLNTSSQSETLFDFSQISVNKNDMSFNGYFKDLFVSFLGSKSPTERNPSPLRLSADDVVSESSSISSESTNLHSMDFSKIQKN